METTTFSYEDTQESFSAEVTQERRKWDHTHQWKPQLFHPGTRRNDDEKELPNTPLVNQLFLSQGYAGTTNVGPYAPMEATTLSSGETQER